MPFLCVSNSNFSVVIMGFTYQGKCYYLFAGLYIISVEQYGISFFIDVLIEYSINGSVVMAVKFLHILVGEFFASLILIPAFQLYRFGTKTEWATELCCLHCIGKGIGSIKLSDKEVAGSDRFFHYIGKPTCASGCELHSLSPVSIFYHHGRIFLWFS